MLPAIPATYFIHLLSRATDMYMYVHGHGHGHVYMYMYVYLDKGTTSQEILEVLSRLLIVSRRGCLVPPARPLSMMDGAGN